MDFLARLLLFFLTKCYKKMDRIAAFHSAHFTVCISHCNFSLLGKRTSEYIYYLLSRPSLDATIIIGRPLFFGCTEAFFCATFILGRLLFQGDF